MRPAAIFLALAAAGAAVADPATVTNKVLGLSFQVPEGYEPAQDVRAANSEYIHAFRRRGEDGETYIIVEALGGLLRQEHATLADLPPGFKGRLGRMRWKAHEIDLIEIPESVNGADLLTVKARIPLRPEGICIDVLGPASRRDELLALLNTTVASVEGSTNWRSNAGGIDGAGWLLIATTGGAIVVGLPVLWFAGRRSRRGVILVAGIVAFAGGQALSTAGGRVSLGLSGTLRMFGVGAVLLGVLDLALKRPGEYRAMVRIRRPVRTPPSEPEAPAREGAATVPRPPRSSAVDNTPSEPDAPAREVRSPPSGES